MRILIFLSILLFLSSCQKYSFDEKKEIKEEKWSYQDSLEFEFEVTDIGKVYNIYLEIKHQSDFLNQNIYTMVHVRFPDGKERKQQVSLELADSKGEWQGKCSGKYCTRRMSFMPNAVFDQKGKYRLKFDQFTRQEVIEGIQSFRLIVEKTETAKEDNTKKKL